ncbi:hypothetical protein IT072_01890 [Leifsonia sp. ZF2019]|uniref:hypothetical protein n=1 Tax=Leifsonia sp. ZF2019 TaxID=2781978 RepID=UPI001CBAB6BA|nr:hypothetical protein [Leifsonia sp. ZF2019]UAJ79855.1 hypothetical protein IT072_01890 [Leifsonia sp. ZF2019]
MTDDNELDPLARLRATDPAAGVEPSAGFVEDAIARANADAGGAGGEDDTAAPLADLDAARSRRRSLWRPIAAVAASIAIIGGAGFAVGTTTAGTTLAGGAAAPISLGGSGNGAGGGATGGSATEGSIAPRAASGSASDLAYRFGFGRNSFTASGLSTSAGTAKAYGFDPRSASDTKTVTALAAALGLSATPELKDGAWTTGPQDGTAPSLSVGLDGTLSFFYSDWALSPAACTTDPGGAGDDSSGASPSCTPTAPLPSADAAISALRSLISSAGRDPGSFEFTSETYDGAVTRTAQAWLVVDGQRVDQSWSLELAESGIVSASGFLAPVVSAGDYPVVSAQKAFERLSDPRFGPTQTAMPLAARAVQDGAPAMSPVPADGATDGATAPATQPPAAPSAGTPLAWPVHRVHIVSARLGLASQWQPDGSVLLVPAYELTDADGGTWSVIAVADDALDFSGQ